MAEPDADADFREFAAARLERLRRLAFLMCGDTHRAEDAVQQALARLYSVWHRRTAHSVDAYVRRIVINAVKSEYRGAWFRRERVTDAPLERAEADSSASTADRMAILSAPARLPMRQRAAVVLRYWEDRSVDETAEILRCSAGTVKTHSSRGLERLRGLLSDSFPLHDGKVSA
ncbi:MAG: SigE family RNA polymerase sigma factor [Stackebrandtia sp.]